MNYAMLVYYSEPDFQALPAAEQERLRQACADWQERLVESGQSTGCMRLRPTATATTLRQKDGQLMLIDGPFAETKEILGGLATLECRDLDEAIACARTFPALPAGFSVELRPVIAGDEAPSDMN